MPLFYFTLFYTRFKKEDEIAMISGLMFYIVLFCFSIFAPVFKAGATPEGDAIRKVDEASIFVSNTCTCTIELSGENTKNKIGISYITGTGFFIRHSPGNHLALTAGHVMHCSNALHDYFFDDEFSANDVESFKVESKVSILYKSRLYDAKVLSWSSNGDIPDIAELSIASPEVLDHGHLTVLENNFLYDLGSGVLIRSSVPYNNERISYLQRGVIADITTNRIQISTHSYNGMSGSAVLFFLNGEYYAIGIISQSMTSQIHGNMDISFVTRLDSSGFKHK